MPGDGFARQERLGATGERSSPGGQRARRGLIQLAWRFLIFQKESALARRYRARTDGTKGVHKTTMIVALARTLLVALWRLLTAGEVPEGVVMRSAA